MHFLIIFLIFDYFAILVTSQWGYNNWNVPNNNLAIGYPTAYGLYAGRGGHHGGWGNDNHPSSGTGFGSPLRCLNGGAHIGQCRLDKDSICIALGGTCSHGACCTTPFVSLNLGKASTTVSVIDGEAREKKRKEKERRTTTRNMRRTTTIRPDDRDEDDEDEDIIKSAELEEWNQLIERVRSTSTFLETSTPPMTVTPYTEIPDKKTCESGLRPVGPCSDDSDCPTLHQCENEQCCYLLLGG